jgi:hypothetical protein
MDKPTKLCHHTCVREWEYKAKDKKRELSTGGKLRVYYANCVVVRFEEWRFRRNRPAF